MKKEKLTCNRARNFSIVQVLQEINISPLRQTERDAWYLSPLRIETVASFHVSKLKNRWYDHGLGKGGNVIDLVVMIKNCSVKEALDYLAGEDGSFSFQQQRILGSDTLTICEVKEINHPALLQYLDDRRIPALIAREYCKEVFYQVNNKNFFAIGLQNSLGGWEFRNKYFKTSTSPKSYTYLKNDSNQLLILEGMFDFLSLATLYPELVSSSDCIVLNSLSFLEEIEALVPNYQQTHAYLDNDPAGRRATERLKSICPYLVNMSDFYRGYGDLNDLLVN